jgi:hypothetical protein
MQTCDNSFKGSLREGKFSASLSSTFIAVGSDIVALSKLANQRHKRTMTPNAQMGQQ